MPSLPIPTTNPNNKQNIPNYTTNPQTSLSASNDPLNTTPTPTSEPALAPHTQPNSHPRNPSPNPNPSDNSERQKNNDTKPAPQQPKRYVPVRNPFDEGIHERVPEPVFTLVPVSAARRGSLGSSVGYEMGGVDVSGDDSGDGDEVLGRESKGRR